VKMDAAVSKGNQVETRCDEGPSFKGTFHTSIESKIKGREEGEGT